MLKAKALALCVCPVVAAPPTILAVHPPARHAVAHLLHHAANRLDRSPAHRAAPVAAAPLPCAPSLASAGGLPVTGGSIIGSVAAQPAVAAVDTTPGRFDGTSLYGSDVGGSAIAGSIGGAFGGGPFGGGLLGGGGPAGAPDRGSVTGGAPGSSGPAGGALPVSGPGAVGNGTPTPVAPVQSGSPSTPVSGAPEPTAWMLLAVARRPRRPATGAAGED